MDFKDTVRGYVEKGVLQACDRQFVGTVNQVGDHQLQARPNSDRQCERRSRGDGSDQATINCSRMALA